MGSYYIYRDSGIRGYDQIFLENIADNGKEENLRLIESIISNAANDLIARVGMQVLGEVGDAASLEYLAGRTRMKDECQKAMASIRARLRR